MSPANRYCVFHSADRPDDQREPGQRDRDRILYTSAFRRLAGVTQVASAGEGYVFHNRLTHTLEVAQIARRLAEHLIKKQGKDVAEGVGGVDPDVVETAALAHDLGHPPFGHIAEEVLDQLIRENGGDSDGFEGNPQSFRIVTKLALRHQDFPGLNLRRATLNAILKYPWPRATGGGKRERKWGAYRSESEEFNWARELCPPGDKEKSAEAEIMDWADDIAYSIHDVEDFYRARLIPLDRLIKEETERIRFQEEVFARWRQEQTEHSQYSDEDLKSHFHGIVEYIGTFPPLRDPYVGNKRQRAALRSLTAALIGRYLLEGIQLHEPTSGQPRRVEIEPSHEMEITMLKQLTWHYVIRNPALATQQYGQRQLIRDLFRIFSDAATSKKDWAILPIAYQEQLESVEMGRDSEPKRRRIVADLISGLTEQQAIAMHQRLMGNSSGSMMDPIIID